MKVEQFSPTKSPHAKSLQGKNLTGNARHVRDLAADIHADIQRWNELHLQGVSLLKAITQEKCNDSYSQSLQELCDKLESICDSLDGIAQNLKQLAHQINIITSLHKGSDKLFSTWSTEQFGSTAEYISKAYNEEIKVKRKVLENIAHNHTESWKMLHLATWTYQPTVSDHVTTLVESLLIETGHR